MAVDYFHRLVVTGDAKRVRRLARGLHRDYPRTVAGETWTEVVPFSFEALYEMAPRARRIEHEIPCDPYELSAWPVRVSAGGNAAVRYQFQTRNMELAPFIRLLAAVQPKLDFTLVTLCLDDSSIESRFFSGGKWRTWTLPERLRTLWWDRARKKFRLKGDDVYDDDDAERWAEEQMLAEALGHWRTGESERARARRYRWWNQVRLRDLDTERQLALYGVAEALAAEETAARGRQKQRKTGTRQRRTRSANSRRRA
jgi:hypothetical protein